MKCATFALIAAGTITVAGAAAQASTVYDANVSSPGWINGSGNPNGGFTVVQDNGIELGLRAKYRQNPNVIHSLDNNYSVVPGAQTNTTSGGNGAAPTRAAWNYEFSINLNPTNATSGYLTLNDITAALTISDTHGHSATVNPLTYWADNTGFGPSGKTTPAVAATDWLAQNSQNPAFGDFPLAAFYNMNAPDTYTFKLDVSGPRGDVLASDTINVTVVPVPSAAWGGLAMLGGLGVVTGVKRLRREQPC
jgi:hypothetical protein